MLKRYLAICTVQILLGGVLSADETYWDSNLVRSYVHNSDLQRRWAMAFLAPSLKQLNGDEKILDIGCGDGKITADISKFIPQGTITGIDPSQAMLDWAKKQYSPLEYPNVTFHEGGFLEPQTDGLFDVIISNCALQHCLDQARAFKTLSALLKPNGKLFLSIPAIDNMAWKQARKNLQSTEKWAVYWKNVAPRKFLSIQEYALLLSESNFSLLRIEKVTTRDPFFDKEEFLSFLLGTFTPAVANPQLNKDFYNELIDEYIRLLPEVNQEGIVEARFGRIEIEAIRLP